ncbi:MAG: YdcF family protein [Candidatus Glassbacteria bacterium]|nr:YdcF family protein [Candidatus Glassbacteria bacterium]
MLTNEDIICFSSIDWDFNWQGHQEVMRTLAAAGNKVLFVENTGVRRPSLRDYERLVSRVRNWWSGYKGIRQVEKNLFVFSPIILPFPYSRPARWLNRLLILRVLKSWCRSARFSSPIVWTFLPSPLTLEVIEKLPLKLLIYYCIDSFEHSSAGAARIREHEKRMVSRADLVFVTSELLRRHCLKYNQAVYKFPFTVNFEPFDRARNDRDLPAPGDLAPVKKPCIGYVGGLHRWLDQSLLVELAAGLPECSFVFVGPLQEPMQSLQQLPNVHLLGGKPHEQLPVYLRHFDLGLIPYRKTDYTDNVYPTKLNEYLAMGLPVVSTAINEIVEFDREHPGMVDVCRTAREMAEAIRRRLSEPGDAAAEEAVRKRVELARLNSWSFRIEQMSGLIREKISELRSMAEAGWRRRLAETLRVSRKRILTLAAAVLLVYGGLYWTPLIYLIGRPLIIEEAPAKASLILVFGGGLGETGRPGTSTIERARFAADLYHRGIAPKVVFSSGFQQYSNMDVEDMRKIGLAEGVSPEDILLEMKAANNYENVVNSLELMDGHGFSSAVVVTSLYNTLRTDLIFRRQLERPSQGVVKRDSLYLVPVETPIFFNRMESSRLAQLRAILHEYAAIVYYWWQGWL